LVLLRFGSRAGVEVAGLSAVDQSWGERVSTEAVTASSVLRVPR
jgi:hypothetical protein